jgi:hypothetical protein
MLRRPIFAMLAVVLAMLALAAPALAGGWAIVTLDSLPREVRAGEKLSLGFMVRQHGRTPTNDVTPYLRATKPGTPDIVRADARQAGALGHFVVDITFPSDGTWEWQVVPKPFEGTAFAPMMVLPASAPAAAAPQAEAPGAVLGVSAAVWRAAGLALLLAAAGILFAQRGVLARRVARAP